MRFDHFQQFRAKVGRREFNHEDNDPVDILITMAAVDANTHQEVGIMQIVNLFEDEENFDRLRACRTEQGKDFACIGNFGVSQYDFVRVERFQIANRTHAFAHAQNGSRWRGMG